MTDQEHAAVIGALTVEYSANRQQRARLAERLQGIGRAVEHFGAALRNVQHVAPPPPPADYLDRTDITGLLRELQHLDVHIADLRRRLVDAGVAL